MSERQLRLSFSDVKFYRCCVVNWHPPNIYHEKPLWKSFLTMKKKIAFLLLRHSLYQTFKFEKLI